VELKNAAVVSLGDGDEEAFDGDDVDNACVTNIILA
jgi:hypothetical protein